MKASVKREVEKIIEDYNILCSPEEFKTYRFVNWEQISEKSKLSEDFIHEFRHQVKWAVICINQKLSLAFIHEHKEQVNWFAICRWQKLSLTFIRKHKSYVDWVCISEDQNLSESFIWEFKSRLDMFTVFVSRKLSASLVKRLKVMFFHNRDYLSAKRYLNRSFKLKSDKQKLREVKDYAKKWSLEFDGEYLYAFREHDKEGRGAFNKTIFYDEIGKEYRDWHCDMDKDDTASFGLGIWPKTDSVNTRIKVHYKDWGCEVSDACGKGRVMAFTLLGPIEA